MIYNRCKKVIISYINNDVLKAQNFNVNFTCKNFTCNSENSSCFRTIFLHISSKEYWRESRSASVMIFDMCKKLNFTWFSICFFSFMFVLLLIFIFRVKKNFFFVRIFSSMKVVIVIETFFFSHYFIQIDIMSSKILMNLNQNLILNVLRHLMKVKTTWRDLIIALTLLYLFRTCFSNSERESRIENSILETSKSEILKLKIFSNVFSNRFEKIFCIE